jgi:putative FmdB family regulatory protein
VPESRRDRQVPTYEYSCKSCGEHLEVVQSFKDDALTVCPNCGGELRKVFGSIGIVFKGSGFYKNDSRAGHGAKKPAAESSGGSDSAAATSGGEAAKPAATESTSGSKPDASPAPAAAAAPAAAPSNTGKSNKPSAAAAS